jgi:hypothetical protein
MFDLTGTRLIYKTYKTYSSFSQWRAVCRYMHYTTSTIKEGWPQLKDNNLGVFFTAQKATTLHGMYNNYCQEIYFVGEEQVMKKFLNPLVFW